MPLSTAAVASLRGLVDAAVANPTTDIPGVTVVVVDKQGNELFHHAAGQRGATAAEPLTTDSMFWLASCTKLVTSIAVMQLVEQGRLRLDDADQLVQLCPELTGLDVLRADGSVEKQKRAITLRMLLTHTAGFGYSFFNERLRDWALSVGHDEFSSRFEEQRVPLLFQPGEGWEYGTGLDWAGVALERVTGQRLNDYLQEHVLRPLGLTDTTMLPTPAQRARLVYCHDRLADGTLHQRPHPHSGPLVVDADDAAAVAGIFHSAGAGLFGRPADYARVLAVLLNDGTCARTGAVLLQPATVAAMFTNQIPDLPDFGRQPIAATVPALTASFNELYPEPERAPQGWGISFMLANSTATGRSPRTAQWAGLINIWWWCDRDTGVAGLVAAQILPFGDPKVMGLWTSVEAAVYADLAK